MPKYIMYVLVATSWFAGLIVAAIAGGYVMLEALHWMVLNPPW